jgi:hypothetical protein
MKSSTSRRRRQLHDGNLRLQRIFLSLTAAVLIAATARSAGASDARFRQGVSDFFSDPTTVDLTVLGALLLTGIAVVWTLGIARRTPHRRGPHRRSMIDVVLPGLVCLLLLGQVLTGLSSALSGGGIQTTHLASAALLIALPVVFILAEYVHGQIALVLRVLSPGPLPSAPPPPRIGELARFYVPASSASSKRRGTHASLGPAHIHRLALVAVAVIAAVMLAISIRPDGAAPEFQTAGMHRPAQR